MISTSEALSLINQSTRPLEEQTITLEASLNKVLSKDAVAQIDLPPFAQSAMDGYALKFHGENIFRVIGEIKAGDDASSIQLQKGEAIKIFTGAMCPESADAVCRIEDIDENDKQILVNTLPKTGSNIRLQGEQIKTNEIGLTSGSVLNPAGIGFLANLGVNDVKVITSPQINIVSTGNELLPPGDDSILSLGKIFESNSIMLQQALLQHGFRCNTTSHLDDDYAATLSGLSKKLEDSDVLIISGGISVGDYDFVGKALLELGVEQVFYKVNQKPGKPLFFGTKGNKLVFALPGNPAAALTCFYVYILPALNKLAGKGFSSLNRIKAKLTTPIGKANSREQFLKAHFENGQVNILEGQSSAMLKSYANSNALVHLSANTIAEAGMEVDVIVL